MKRRLRAIDREVKRIGVTRQAFIKLRVGDTLGNISFGASMRTFVVAAAVVGSFFIIAALRAEQSTPTVTVVRDPGCGCCLSWVQHLQRAGFKTTVTESAQRIQNTPTVPASARSCHTATVDGYLIEGHVPVADIKRLLQERPKIAGIAAPGMPAGSPGMEVPSGAVAPYDVIAFDAAGKVRVFASHR